MAAPPPLLLSLFLVLSLSSISYCSDEGTTNSPTTSKDAVIQYWNLQFPNKPLPSFFLSKLSPLSPLQLMATSNIHGSGAIGDASNSEPDRKHATANYESEAYRKPVTANYDSDSETYRNPVTANYDSEVFRRPVTANYDSEVNMRPVTANYDSGSEKHATANYDSDAYRKPVTANYDPDSDANRKPVTANYNSDAYRKLVTANYDSDSDANRKPVTANYDSDSNANRKPVTANYNSDAYRKPVTANYDSDSDANRKPVTANYDSDSDANRKPVTTNDDSNSDAYKKPVTANYDFGARRNHATANYASKPSRKAVTANYDAPKDHPITNNDPLNSKAYRYHAATKNDASNSKASMVHAAANNIRMVTGDGATGKAAKRSSNLNVFFRENNLTRDTIMPMCDIKATMPQMPLLPRSIATMLPFSSPHEVKKHFRIPKNSRMSKDIDDTISNCNSAPSKGETKACLTSAEDVIDFIRLNLGPTATLKNTESAGGSEGDIIIGEVKSVKGDKLTKLAACHQVAFPYMVYLCHSVPKVKMYEADILDAETKEKINHGIAVCHFDTSNWSEGHVAFVELGFKPGEIEACHWMFEGEMAAFAE